MAPHSSPLAWKIPWTEEAGGLQSMGSRRVGHDWVTSLWLFTFMHWRRKWQPTPVFLPRESQGREPGGLPSMGSHRVGHDWSDLAAAAAAVFHWINAILLIFPTTSWKAFGLFPVFGIYEQSCYKDLHTKFCINTCFHFFSVMELLDHIWWVYI